MCRRASRRSAGVVSSKEERERERGGGGGVNWRHF